MDEQKSRIDNEKVKKAFQAVSGLNYLEWRKLCRMVNLYFRKETSEFQNNLKLACDDETINFLERFG